MSIDNFRCTDLGNGERLAAWHGEDLRHVPAWGWLVWDGRRWTADDRLARGRAHRVARQLYYSAGDHPDSDARARLTAWAVRSEGAARLSAMLEEARALHPILANPGDFDRDPWLLNVANGTVDLRTGELHPHRREDLITKLIELDYNPALRSELWDAFLDQATACQEGLADFLRRAAGYTITGFCSEDAVFLLHGPSWTGKTTLVEVLRSALGSYAGTIPIEALITSGTSPGGHNENLARLAGLRMVTAVEASENERLREGTVKHMTGSDHIAASLKYRPAFDFKPQFALWLATNEVPYIRPDDSGMWHRVHKLPFENVHGKSDVRERLLTAEHLPAVLAWAVRGCLEWQRRGLQPPAGVASATEQLRVGMDGAFDLFLDQHCRLGDRGCWSLTRDIRATYTVWALRMGIPEVRRATDKRMAQTLRRRGCEDDRRREPFDPDDPDARRDPLRGWWGIEVFDCPWRACDACAGCDSTSRKSPRESYRENFSKYTAHPAEASQSARHGG